jgi:hypothetical protein
MTLRRSIIQDPEPYPEIHTADAGILQFGASVSISDDLRRGIVAELEEINVAAAKISEKINVEKKIQAQVLNDRSVSDKELSLLRRGTAETAGVLEMNEQVRLGFYHTVQKGILLDSFNNPSPNQLFCAQVEAMDVDGENVSPTIGTSILAIQKKHSLSSGTADNLEVEMDKVMKLMRSSLNEKATLTKEASAVARRMQADGLEQRLLKELMNTKSDNQSLEDERKRKSALKMKALSDAHKDDLEKLGTDLVSDFSFGVPMLLLIVQHRILKLILLPPRKMIWSLTRRYLMRKKLTRPNSWLRCKMRSVARRKPSIFWRQNFFAFPRSLITS